MGKVTGRVPSNYIHYQYWMIEASNAMFIGHAFLAAMALSLASIGAAYDFTANDCYLPKAQGGQGYCGPSQCQNIPTNTNSACDFSAACSSTNAKACTSTIDYQASVCKLT